MDDFNENDNIPDHVKTEPMNMIEDENEEELKKEMLEHVNIFENMIESINISNNKSEIR